MDALAWWYRQLLERLATFGRVVFAVRASFVMAVVAGAAIYGPAQIAEVLRMLVDPANDRRLLQSAVFVAAATFAGLSIWYWARVSLYLTFPGVHTEHGTWRGWLVRHVPRLIGAVPLVASAAALDAVGDFPREALTDDQRLLGRNLNGLAIACLILALMLYVLQTLRRFLHLRSLEAPGSSALKFWRHLPTTSLVVLGALTACGLLAFLAVVQFPVTVASSLGTPALIMFWVGTLLPLLAILADFGRLTRVPWLGLLVAAALVLSYFDLNDNHTIRHEAGVREGLPPSHLDALSAWLDERADRHLYEARGERYPVFFIAAEGGGIRAAYFAGVVLATLQDLCPRFAQHTFVISGVSGGSMGASVFAASAARRATNEADLPCGLTRPPVMVMRDEVDAVLRADMLSPLIGAMLYPDLVQRFLPFPVAAFDRARALELALEDAWSGATNTDLMAQSFHLLWENAEPGGAVPALMLNTTSVETGQRMVVSHFYPLDERFNWLETLADVDWTLDLPLSTAAVLSARFPLITPAGTVPIGADADGDPVAKLRFVDGGYFENSGTDTVAELIDALRLDREANAPNIKPILVRIENGEATTRLNEAPSFAREPLPRYAGFSLGEVLSPIRAFLNTRVARGTLAKNRAETLVAKLLDSGVDAEMIIFALQPSDVPLPLGWALSEGARREILRQLGDPQLCGPIRGIDNSRALGQVVEELLHDHPGC